MWAHLICLTGALLAFLTISGCRRGTPVVDATPGTAPPRGTISGTVRGPESSSPVEGRLIEVVNVETNERHRVSTNSAGGFRLTVKPGNYRVELALRNGEALVKQPGVMSISRSGVDAHADFVIGNSRISRPRGPAYRMDHGLGSPVA
jgi:hypothetical protein